LWGKCEIIVEKHVNKAFCISLEAGKLKEFMWKIVNPRLKNIIPSVIIILKEYLLDVELIIKY